MIKLITPIERRWPMQSPFLLTGHHLDYYPRSNGALGLDPSHLEGREIGSDFIPKDGFKLYHGKEIPGFPAHPHRGFETITIVKRGYIDHADSLGGEGRYGEGDVQWMNAGCGIQHSEMFPLLNGQKENVLELFQIWINLPRVNKMKTPEYKMIWSENIPKFFIEGGEVRVINGEYEDIKIYNAPLNSWATDPKNQVSILMVCLRKGAIFKLGKKEKINRSIYLYRSESIILNNEEILGENAVFIDSTDEVVIEAKEECEFLVLDGTPIEEEVVQYGPFVMNTQQEIVKAIQDFQSSQFGGWKWNRRDVVHGVTCPRFAKYIDGSTEYPDEEFENNLLYSKSKKSTPEHMNY